jgi:hypothetical protein
MRLHQAFGALALGLVTVVVACASSGPPPANPGVTSAQRVDSQTAAYKVADATCRHAQACNEIGGSRTYATKTACLDQNKGKSLNDLRTSECPRGVDSTRLEACVTAIAAEACSGMGSGFSRSMQCNTGELCP